MLQFKKLQTYSKGRLHFFKEIQRNSKLFKAIQNNFKYLTIYFFTNLIMDATTTGSAQNIYDLIEAALEKVSQEYGRKTANETFSDLIKQMQLETSKNKSIVKNLNAGTLQRSIFQKARKAVKYGEGEHNLTFSSIYLNSLSQYVHNVDFKQYYGEPKLDSKIQQDRKHESQRELAGTKNLNDTSRDSSSVDSTLKEFDFTPNTKDENIQSVISEIADELAYNYFSNSFGNDEVRKIANCGQIFKPEQQKKIEKRWKKPKSRTRNILVVGSGATFDAYRAIPMSEEFIEQVKKFFEKDLEPDEARYIEDFKNDKLEQNNGLLLADYFKTIGEFLNPGKIQEKIKDLVEFRYSVSLFNEIVAHMLKHSFLDVVVNFNFEETLDQAILEEIGLENYHHVINDGNCVMLDQILVDGRLQSPVYIKPHDTYSYKSSLRVNGENHQKLPGDIKIMLQELLSGKCGKDDYFDRVNIIMVGFADNIPDFNEILNKNLPKGSVIYHIDANPFLSAKSFFDQKKLNIFKEKRLNFQTDIEEAYRPLSTAGFNHSADQSKNNKLTPNLGELFSMIWRVQNDAFRPAYKPRSIARHELISYLFYRPELGAKTNSHENFANRKHFTFTPIEKSAGFFTDRLMVEFFILLNRNNGMLDVVELLRGRVGFYYNKYRKIIENETGPKEPVQTIYEFLHTFSKDDPGNPDELLRQTSEFNRGANIFTLISEFKEDDLEPEIFPGELQKLLNSLKGSLKQMQNPEDYKLYKEELENLIDNFVADITDYLQNWYYSISQPLKTSSKNPKHELVKFGRAVTIIYRLLKSEFVSSSFKINLLYNYKRKVFNGKSYTDVHEDSIGDGEVMFNELFRLLRKSWGHHYFVIDPKPANPAHNLWESFTRKKVIHTNLARAAEFNHLLIEKDWNVFLSISETGSFLNFLYHLDENLQEKSAKKAVNKIKHSHFVVICSYESIKQLYPGKYDNEGKVELVKAHSKRIRATMQDGSALIENENFTLLILPFNQHNHHSYIFLKPGENLNDSLNNTILTNESMRFQDEPLSEAFEYDAVGSIYFYRRGLSNSIDPIYIGRGEEDNNKRRSQHISRDQVRLLDIFVKHLNRSFKFELVKRKGNKEYWPKAPWLLELQKKWEEKINDKDVRFKDITTSEFLAALYARFK